MSRLSTVVTPVIHNKTGKLYFLLQDVINATNVQDGQKMCLYVNTKGQMFVRERKEFFEKFTSVQSLINNNNNINELKQLSDDIELRFYDKEDDYGSEKQLRLF